MISVIVPIFNQEKYLDKAITSLLSQTYCDFEIILVDDGSTDKSLDICNRFASEHSQIRVIHKENGGLSSARNCGMAHAKGNYMIFPDPDDWVEPGYLEALMNLHEKYHTDLEICNYFIRQGGRERIYQNVMPEGTIDADASLLLLMRHDGMGGNSWNKLFHSSIIKQNGLRFDEELLATQDRYFCYQYICCCSNVSCTLQPLYHYNLESGVSAPETPLTTRKMTGLNAYVKIGKEAERDHPEMVSAIYAMLFNTALNYMYSYFNTGMKEPEKLNKLRKCLEQNEEYFYASKIHSLYRKMLARLAMVSPRLYYLCSKMVRKMKHFE